MSGRDLIASLAREIGVIVRSFREGAEETRPPEEPDFFSSYESSYALTLAYPDDIIIESARGMGIEVEGKERIEIVREMFLGKGSPFQTTGDNNGQANVSQK